jgi:hypothetical protein
MNAMRATLLPVLLFIATTTASAQQPIDPVDFRPFVDGRHWIVRQPLTYRIGISNATMTVPVGFVTDFASIPQALQSIIRQNGLYILPAVVHDYLYWKQTCTREQADQIFMLAMIENKVADVHRFPIHAAVRAAGSFAWDDNAKERAANLIRILPKDRMTITAATLWPDHRLKLTQEGVVNGADNDVPAVFCARGSMTITEALETP